jgi:hypothetical protein
MTATGPQRKRAALEISRNAGRRSTIIALCVLVQLTAWPALAGEGGAGRVVVVGDVHGEIEGLTSVLRAAELINSAGHWSGGQATLVQTGDLVERGTAVREVLDLVMRLEEEAPRAGGRVVPMLGNHEAYNLYGFLDYTSTPPEAYEQIFATFADQGSEDRLERAAKKWKRWKRRFPQCGAQTLEEWAAAHPPGFIEYFEAFGPDGRYGKWLRELPLMVRIGSTLYSHGGPGPALPEMGLESIWAVNTRAETELAAFDELRDELVDDNVILPFFTLGEIYCSVKEALQQIIDTGDPARREEGERLLEILQSLPAPERTLVLHEDGPLWYRGYARLPDEEAETVFADLLERWGVERIVVGHTPQKGTIVTRFDRVFLVDTAMTFGSEAGGRAAALEIEGESVSAIYPDSREVLVERAAEEAAVRSTAEPEAGESAPGGPGSWLGPDGLELPLVDDREAEEFLRSARILSNEPIPIGITHPRKLVLEKFDIRAHAVFRYLDEQERNKRLRDGRRVIFFRDTYRNEVAAYRLSRLLGFETLPPAVERKVDGAPGSVQLWIEQAMTEKDRLARDLQPPDTITFRQQIYDMRVFDNLINNFDRNQGNVLIDRDWTLWLIDHTRSFGQEAALPEPDTLVRCSRRLWAGLAALDEERLEEALGEHLGKGEIRSILARRDAIVELLSSRFATLGEDRVLFTHGDPTGMESVIVQDFVPPEPEVEPEAAAPVG